MKVLVYPHDLAIGGSQINAIDLAAAIVDQGHEALVYGVPGPLVDLVAERGLTFVPADDAAVRPSPARIAEVRRLVRREQVEVIHAYEWPPCLDAYYGAHLRDGVPLVSTVLSMHVPAEIPRGIPLVMGTGSLAAEAEATRGGPVSIMEPPIDVFGDHPGLDGRGFRHRHGIGDDETLVVTVSRLSVDLKRDALLDLVDAAGALAGRSDLRVVIVGDGDAAAEIRARAAAVNVAAGRELVLVPGSLADPRPAYAAADVVVGMGSSSLRAMAIGRPVVVQGERGWSLPCDPDTITTFRWQGFYGVGEGQPGGETLAAHLRPLLDDPELRSRLGCWGRRLVVDDFSLQGAATRLLDLYERTVADAATTRPRWRDAASAGVRAARTELDLHKPAMRRVLGLDRTPTSETNP